MTPMGRNALVGAAGFFRWWTRTLAEMVPGRLRRWVAPRVPRLEIMADRYRLVRGEKVLAAGRLSEDALPLRPYRHWDLVVGGQDVLWRRVALPAAAGSSLARVVSYSLHRLTPFRTEDVHFGCRAVQRDKEAGTISVTTGILLRSVVREIVSAAGATEPPSRLWLRDGEGHIVPAASEDAAPAGRYRLLSHGAVAAALGAGLVMLLLSDGRQDREREALVVALSEAKEKAGDIAMLERRLDALRLRSSYAVNLRNSRPLIVETLAALTGRLPDSVWLDYLELDGDDVRLSGEGPSAVAVLNLIDGSAAFSGGRLAAPVTPVPSGSGERFSIVASREGGSP